MGGKGIELGAGAAAAIVNRATSVGGLNKPSAGGVASSTAGNGATNSSSDAAAAANGHNANGNGAIVNGDGVEGGGHGNGTFDLRMAQLEEYEEYLNAMAEQLEQVGTPRKCMVGRVSCNPDLIIVIQPVRPCSLCFIWAQSSNAFIPRHT